MYVYEVWYKQGRDHLLYITQLHVSTRELNLNFNNDIGEKSVLAEKMLPNCK